MRPVNVNARARATHMRESRMFGVYIINKRDFIRSHADPCGYQRHYNARKLISRLNLSTFL